MEASKPVQQAFGSPGGKSYLAPRIASMMPPHETYVEPFAGGAAVYFRKEPSKREVLSDKDSGIAFAFKFLRDMTPQQWQRLRKKNWVKHKATFDKVKASKPKDDVEHFYRFYYLRRASFGKGGASFSTADEGKSIGIDRLYRVHERLQKAPTQVHSADATSLISKYDSPGTFFYLDPPYPGRAFIGQTFKDWTEEDLQNLIAKLKGIKGKFALSLGTEHTKFIPSNWHINRVKVWRRIPTGEGAFNQTSQYEIIATNYDPTKKSLKVVTQIEPVKTEHRSYTLVEERGNGHKRIPVGVFSDKRGDRFSRRYHRGWKRVSFS